MKRALCVGVVLLFAACQRERRELQPAQEYRAMLQAVPTTSFRPGGGQPPVFIPNPLKGNAYDVSEGRRLYNWFNCSGCHFNGGGGIGPPLMDQEWIYGGEPSQIYDTILRGRPNGMPAWGRRIPDHQLWQIVTYVRSLAGQESPGATTPRQDTMFPLSDQPQQPAEPPPGEKRPPSKP